MIRSNISNSVSPGLNALASRSANHPSISHPPASRRSTSCSLSTHANIPLFQTESIGRIANLHRLTPLIDENISSMREPYTPLELNHTHNSLISLADNLSSGLHKRGLIGVHGTLQKEIDAIMHRVESVICEEGDLQLGEGFYIAAGQDAEEVANTFAEISSFQIKRRQKGFTDRNIADEHFKVYTDEQLKPVLLNIHAKSFKTMKGLIVPKKFQRSNPVNTPDPKQSHWLRDPYKQQFITQYDYIISDFNSSFFTGCYQIKFNPRAYGNLKINT